ncbi:MAG: hypothetical protein J1E96_01290 [Ruminococcus sp.]|nr:hypothetical protein [Ruminococcus sp.]
MAIFDDVVVNAKSAAAAVSKKAGAFYDLSKLRISAAGLRGELNKKYAALGESVYNNDPEATVEEIKAEIAEIKQNIADIEKIISSTSNTTFCTVCGEKLPKAARFCLTCGNPVAKVEYTPADEPATDEVSE